MRFHPVIPTLFGAIAVLTVAAPRPICADERKDDAPVTLKYTYKAGDVQHLDVLIKANVQGADATVHSTRKYTIKEIKDSGDVVIRFTDEGGTLTLNGADQPQDPAPDIDLTRDKQGKLTDFKPSKEIAGQLTPEVLQTIEELSVVVLPDKAVKANDTWTNELDNPNFKAKKITISDTYLGTEKVDGVDLWKIKQSAKVPLDGEGGVTTYEGTLWLDPATGHIIKHDASVKDLPTAAIGNVSFTLLVTPVKEEKKDDKKDDKPADKATDKKPVLF